MLLFLFRYSYSSYDVSISDNSLHFTSRTIQAGRQVSIYVLKPAYASNNRETLGLSQVTG